jgi:hypothetical protein
MVVEDGEVKSASGTSTRISGSACRDLAYFPHAVWLSRSGGPAHHAVLLRMLADRGLVVTSQTLWDLANVVAYRLSRVGSALLDTLHRALAPSPDIADALCDRLFHHAFKIELKGESIRKTKSEDK